MKDAPTTMNGPLQGDEATSEDRKIVAIFASAAEAGAARDKLLQAGVADGRVRLTSARQDEGAAASAEPPDKSLVGRIRSAMLPDDDTQVYSEAVAHGDFLLAVYPQPEQTDAIVGILETCKPKHFDARLERWRNSGERDFSSP